MLENVKMIKYNKNKSCSISKEKVKTYGKKTIIEYLKTYKRNTIPLSQLENLLTGRETYEDFADVVENLVDKGILIPINSHGTNGKSIPLYNTYRIIKFNLRETLNSEIQYYSIKFNPNIQLDIYFSLDEEEWYKDLPYIEKKSTFI